MSNNRRAMICASIACIALSLSGCKKVITTTIFLNNATTNVTILAVNATAGPVGFHYNGSLPPGGSVGPVARKSVSNPGDHFPITGTAVVSVGGVTKTIAIPPIANNLQIGRTNTITISGTYVTGAPGEIVAVNVDTP